jgi:hypothetical protein
MVIRFGPALAIASAEPEVSKLCSTGTQRQIVGYVLDPTHRQDCCCPHRQSGPRQHWALPFRESERRSAYTSPSPLSGPENETRKAPLVERVRYSRPDKWRKP